MRNFSRLDEAEFTRRLTLHEGIGTQPSYCLNNEIKDRITDRLKNMAELTAEVLCNPGQINQVFMNLLHNAIQAMEESGEPE